LNQPWLNKVDPYAQAFKELRPKLVIHPLYPDMIRSFVKDLVDHGKEIIWLLQFGNTLCLILLNSSWNEPRLLTIPFSVSAITILVFKNWLSSALRRLKTELFSWFTWYSNALNLSVACPKSPAFWGRTWR
jgi:hypothetical protein